MKILMVSQSEITMILFIRSFLRSNYVEFTLPYSESGVSMLVPNKVDDSKNMWIFMRPLEMELWITIGGFFIYIGFVVWVLEHRVNKEFRGPPHQQVGMIFWFSFSTLVFAHSNKNVNIRKQLDQR
ncbi:glutamate receptor 2.7-like [Lactuca sativa]|uniref:glutamate receptor 2.7-like n=1 Tax=Lactuca sativa TaxID=4236 RepID=UPI001C68DC23|nr:glutamate receptor 2.7-like [Lactuca sativa]